MWITLERVTMICCNAGNRVKPFQDLCKALRIPRDCGNAMPGDAHRKELEEELGISR